MCETQDLKSDNAYDVDISAFIGVLHLRVAFLLRNIKVNLYHVNKTRELGFRLLFSHCLLATAFTLPRKDLRVNDVTF